MKAFPPGRRGVLLPCADKRTAALGVCLYTASKRWVVTLQMAAYWVVRILGARSLPGRTELWRPPCTADEWRDLVRQWEAQIGDVDGLAVYQRRQHDRSGLTLVVTRAGARVAVVKLRDTGDTLDREQRALAAITAARPLTFSAPRPLGSGSVGRWHWSAQEAVFSRPHRPVLDAGRTLVQEVSDALTDLVPCKDGQEVPAHRDLTPWNLRRDAKGKVWLYDWEDYGPAPAGSDLTYFGAAAAALGGAGLPADAPSEAIAYCRRVIGARTATNTGDAKLAARMLAALASPGGGSGASPAASGEGRST